MEIKLSDHFTYKKLLQFTVPSIAMMIFTSIYGVVVDCFRKNYGSYRYCNIPCHKQKTI